LSLYEILEESWGGHEFVIGAILFHLAALDDDDAVAILHGGKAVGDDDRGATGANPMHGFLNELLAQGVECAGSLVEKKKRWICEQGACDGKALALSAAEARSPFSNRGVEPMWSAPES
jgi:hypothetical protein